MSKHTPEPWMANGGRILGSGVDTDGGQLEVATMSSLPCIGSTSDLGAERAAIQELANVDRIVTCVNACAEIEDPEDLRRQRDELLELLKEEIDGPHTCEMRVACDKDAWWVDCKSGNTWWFCDGHKPSSATEQHAETRAAIAKAEGKGQ